MNRFAKWAIFGVIFAIAPLAADYFIGSLHNPSSTFSWHDVVSKGELLLVTAAIAGAGVGELIGSGKDWLPFKLVTGGACFVILLVAAELYSSIASDVRLQAVYDKPRLVDYSIYLFFATLIASAGCILAAED
jgi:hypothetical protein